MKNVKAALQAVVRDMTVSGIGSNVEDNMNLTTQIQGIFINVGGNLLRQAGKSTLDLDVRNGVKVERFISMCRTELIMDMKKDPRLSSNPLPAREEFKRIADIVRENLLSRVTP